MPNISARLKSALPVAALCLAALGAAPGAAQNPDLVQIDLIEGWETGQGQMAALRIDVAQGWKTYWRSPGDAGIPPQFDWSGSQNLAAVRVHWPTPKVFEQYGQRSIGYQGQVILPVELIPHDPSKPIQVQGRADLGVCQDVCVAVSASYSASGHSNAPAIKAALAARPDGGAIRQAHCQIEPIEDGLRVTATLSLPDQGGREVAVFEPAQPEIWVSEPQVSRQGNQLTAVADLVPPSATPFALDRSGLRITVLGRDGAAETLGCRSAS